MAKSQGARQAHVISLLALVASAAFAATSSAATLPVPVSASIGSTKGTGAGGCVKSSKAVAFTVQGNSLSIPSSANVYLDGKQIASRSWSLTGPIIMKVQTFTSTVDLSKAKAGKHTLKLVGTFSIFDRRSGPPVARAAATVAQATATITKCATPKKKPVFTG